MIDLDFHPYFYLSGCKFLKMKVVGVLFHTFSFKDLSKAISIMSKGLFPDNAILITLSTLVYIIYPSVIRLCPVIPAVCKTEP